MDDRLISELKEFTGESEESTLSLLLLRAEGIILAETNRSKLLLPEMKCLLIEIALELYNKLGSEGEISRSEGGISVTYTDGFSPHINNILNSYKLARSGGHVFEKKQI